MTVQEGPGTHNTRVVKKRYPIVEGTDFGTTKQSGTRFLRAQSKNGVSSRVLHRKERGI